MPKNIIALFDGTWNNDVDRDQQNNIGALNNSLARKDQLILYYTGVGEQVGKLNRTLWGITGKGIFGACRKAWHAISSNHEAGDKIYIFGFSRGAYAARHLAGMIVRYGIKAYGGILEANFERYLTDSKHPCEVIQNEVQFLGLFDCVPGNYLYLLRDKSFHLNSGKLEKGILNFRHAVSINERRYSFRPILFERGEQQSFAQHWFPGYHSDVGGGKLNSSGLSCFSLWWMMREAYGLGLNFNNIECPDHQAGNNLGVVLYNNPEAPPVNSDYWTTKIGIKWERRKREKINVPDDPVDFKDLNICPRCNHEMFEFFATDYGKSKLKKMGFKNLMNSTSYDI